MFASLWGLFLLFRREYRPYWKIVAVVILAIAVETIFSFNEDYPPANNHFVSEGRFISAADVRRGSNVTVLGFLVARAVSHRPFPCVLTR